MNKLIERRIIDNPINDDTFKQWQTFKYIFKDIGTLEIPTYIRWKIKLLLKLLAELTGWDPIYIKLSRLEKDVCDANEEIISNIYDWEFWIDLSRSKWQEIEMNDEIIYDRWNIPMKTIRIEANGETSEIKIGLNLNGEFIRKLLRVHYNCNQEVILMGTNYKVNDRIYPLKYTEEKPLLSIKFEEEIIWKSFEVKYGSATFNWTIDINKPLQQEIDKLFKEMSWNHKTIIEETNGRPIETML
jgi:hypothetical protein